MGEQAEQFLATFNRIEKWLQNEYKGHQTPGFSELVRRLAQQKELQVKTYKDDLLEMAQLRNAIVHDRIAPDFIIAEPNEWVIQKLLFIESQLTHPAKVYPKFKKVVMTFDKTTSLATILKQVKKNGYLQFPIYDNGQFKGLITAKGIGSWLANHVTDESIDISNQSAESILASDSRSSNYLFVTKETHIFEVVEKILKDPACEAVLITKNGQANQLSLGLIRPKEIFKSYYEDGSESL